MQQNKMEYMPIPKLLANMGIPIMTSMLVQSLYNVIDSMFIARMILKEEALSALSMSFPLQMLIISVSVGTGIGANSLISRLLGQKNQQRASDAAKNSLFLCAIFGIIFFLFGLFFITPYFNFMTKDNTIITMGTSYSKICLTYSVFVIYAIMGEKIIQSTGRTILSMVSQISGAVVNIILDPIFIFSFLGFPKMGISGAAVATVLGQFVSFSVITYFNFKKNHDLDFSFYGFKPDKIIIKEIFRVGLPSIVLQSLSSFMNIGLNSILSCYSIVSISILGIYYKLQSFVFMPVFGLVSAMIPIVSFNFGARHKKRILQTIKLSLFVSVTFMALGFSVFALMGKTLLTVMFDATPIMLKIGVPALRIISFAFIPASIGIVLSSCFQALGNGFYSLVLSFVRQIIIILPLAYILGKIWGLDAIWYAFPFAEFFAFVLAIMFFSKIYKEKIKPIMGDENK